MDARQPQRHVAFGRIEAQFPEVVDGGHLELPAVFLAKANVVGGTWMRRIEGQGLLLRLDGFLETLLGHEPGGNMI